MLYPQAGSLGELVSAEVLITRPAADARTQAPLVALCVCTRGRPVMAARCFRSLQEQAADPARMRLVVIVVDNCAAQTARPVFDAVFAGSSAQYVCCAEPGIPFARNAAVEAALAAGADYIAFIDDDEVAPPGWIDALLTAMNEAGADVVQGEIRKVPLGADLEQAASTQAYAARSWEAVETVATCNTLYKAWLVQGPAGLRFDEAMRYTGGSDRDYFHRASKRGAKVAKVTGAHVVEEIAEGRDSFKYECMRAFAAGNNYTLRMTKNEKPLRGYQRIVTRVLDRGVIGLFKLIFAGLLLLALQTKRAAKQWKKGGAAISFAAGCISPLVGVRAQPYAKLQGR